MENLTALLTMRQRMTTTWDSRDLDQPAAVIVSEEAHYCLERAVNIMGWGDAGVIQAKADDSYRMRFDLLPHTVKEAQKRGVRVIGIIGSACSPATGSFDPLDKIADFCEAENLWFHANAAHAGSFVLSKKAHPLLQGIERADSVLIDFHKMLLGSSLLLTAVLFKNGKDSFESFAQKADYLWQKMRPLNGRMSDAPPHARTSRLFSLKGGAKRVLRELPRSQSQNDALLW